MGRLLDDSNLKWVRRNVGLVFQNPDDQLFSPTVFDDVAFGPLNLGFSSGEVSRKVTQALEWVGLSGYEMRSPHHLSGGEKKRVALATVLCMSPSLLVLDEPTSNLDPEGKWHLVALLKSLPGTKIIVTHDLEIVREICSQVLIMDHGKVVANAATEVVLNDRALLTAYRLVRPDKIELPLAYQAIP
jgi:cobalt/nickel transport system ATP-binding protein